MTRYEQLGPEHNNYNPPVFVSDGGMPESVTPTLVSRAAKTINVET